ncbi:hypothetical protein CERZMDRAFT_90599 [Cercospora zeae-maydis SCOH1-5]|uniref:Uncharacterized protein n=1 Tax=Cercospora zeae-maydis SCOH1-5 TaxID=717836 RepID=A0A6A6FIK7_9PEZI|nr:hypothetical protein CERZMDRAFT_90599 [Cercospora zeae-maydis SCOH1-5]
MGRPASWQSYFSLAAVAKYRIRRTLRRKERGHKETKKNALQKREGATKESSSRRVRRAWLACFQEACGGATEARN